MCHSLWRLFILSCVLALGWSQPSHRLFEHGNRPFSADALGKAVAELRERGLLVIRGLRFENGKVRAWYLPEECSGQKPADCRTAMALDYELSHASGGWAFSIAQPQPSYSGSWNVLGTVAVWCERCEFEGGAGPARGPIATLTVRSQDAPSATAHTAAAGGSVALVLTEAWFPAHAHGQQEGLAGPAVGVARRLQAASGCSLAVDGTTYSFDACPNIAYSNAPFQLFYSLSVDAASGGTVLRGGIRAQGVGWAGWGFGSTRMRGTNTVVVKTSSQSRTGASVAGYLLPSTLASAVNGAEGSWAVKDAVAALDAGDLVAVFTVTLPSSVATLTASPYPYIWATGSVSAATGALREHSDYSSARLTLTAPTATNPAPSPAAVASPVPAPGSPPAVIPTVPGDRIPIQEAPGTEGKDGEDGEGKGEEEGGDGEGGEEEGNDDGEGGSNSGPVGGTSQNCLLGLGGSNKSFASCGPITVLKIPFNLFWEVLPAADVNSATRQVLFGFNGTTDGSGYIALGFPTRPRRMSGASAFILYDDSKSTTGASMQGYYLGSTSQKDVQPPARLTATNLTAARTSANGASWLSGSFVVELDSAQVSAPTTNLIFAQGPISGSTPLEHDTRGDADVALQAGSSGGSGSSNGTGGIGGSDSGTTGGTPGGGSSAGSGAAVTEGCELLLGGSTQDFASCSAITDIIQIPFNVMWEVLSNTSTSGRRLQQSPGTVQVRFGMNGTTDGQGYIAMGFPSTPGQMTDSNAFILQTCSSCASGASILGYYLAGTAQSDVKSPVRMTATGLVAARTTIAGQQWLSGSFVVELDASVLTAPSTPLIFAQGPISGSGTPLRHDVEGAADLNLQGGMANLSSGGDTEAKKSAHAWIMTISWGVLIPAGIVMARCFKELDPFWFKVHRLVQTFAYLLSIAGFALGFAIRESWETPYPVHRNLGVAVTALGLAQMTALFARPLKTHRLRKYWNWNHWWIGRAAGACAIANIYYGIVNVEKLGTWAWASYTGVLGAIAAVWIIKDSMDFYQGKRKFIGKNPDPKGVEQPLVGPLSSSQGDSSGNGDNSQFIKGSNGLAANGAAGDKPAYGAGAGSSFRHMV